jgi:hypothetical protein
MDTAFVKLAALLANVAVDHSPAFFLRHSAHTIDTEQFCPFRQVSNISLLGNEVTHHLAFQVTNQMLPHQLGVKE